MKILRFLNLLNFFFVFCFIIFSKILFAFDGELSHLTSDRILVLANAKSQFSLKIAKLYLKRRNIPIDHFLTIDLPLKEEISRAEYISLLERPLQSFLQNKHLEDKILAIVLMPQVPLKIKGKIGPNGDAASVDSELSLLYRKMLYGSYRLTGWLPNPLFNVPQSIVFDHDNFDIYLVTRLAGYDENDVKNLIENAILASNVRPPYCLVLDAKNGPTKEGDNWLHATYLLLKSRKDLRFKVSFDQDFILYAREVIGYASWGSNDKAYPANRHLKLHFLPGAIGVTFVSTNARTFHRPPSSWRVSPFWDDKSLFFEGSPQSLIADLIHLGITGIVGNVYEPYLFSLVRPYILFPLYFQGFPLAEAFYRALPFLSWQSVIVGDPLANLGKNANEYSLMIDNWFKKRKERFLQAQKRRSPSDRIFLAKVQILLGHPNKALQEIKPLLSSQSSQISEELWTILPNIGVTSELRAHLRKLLRRRQENEAKFLEALFHYKDHNYSESERILSLLLKENVHWPQASLLAGKLYLRKGQCSAALSLIKKAFTLSQNEIALLEMYRVFKKCKKEKDAEKLKKKILSIPSLVEFWPQLK